MEEKGLIVKEGIADVEPVALDKIEKTVAAIDALKKRIMIKDTHYGKIPGVDKDVLLQPGAEKLAMAFRLIPQFEIQEREMGNGHIEIVTHCALVGPQGNYLGACTGSASTLEKKYRWRNSERLCPKCGKAAIIKGSEKFGGGWVCWKKKDGCGAKFEDGDPTIEAQVAGQVENTDIADVYNTVRKMSQKRAFVGAVIRALSASDIFTQDVEDMPQEMVSKSSAGPSEPVPTPFKYNRKAIGALIPDANQQREVWATAKAKYHAHKDDLFIYTSAAVPGWDSALVRDDEVEGSSESIDDYLPWEEPEEETPKPSAKEQVKLLKEKIAKKKE